MPIRRQDRMLACMQKISRKYLGKDWADGLEYTLWHWINSKENVPITAAERYALHMHYVRNGGWFTVKRGKPIFVTAEVWHSLYRKEFPEEGDLFSFE